jgi:hypothetical protein
MDYQTWKKKQQAKQTKGGDNVLNDDVADDGKWNARGNFKGGKEGKGKGKGRGKGKGKAARSSKNKKSFLPNRYRKK